MAAKINRYQFVVVAVLIACLIQTAAANSQCTPEFNDLISNLFAWRTEISNRDHICPIIEADKVPTDSTLMIDIRSEHEFSTSGIKDSINVPATALAHKTSLKRVPILLLDVGYRQERTLSVCANLLKKGFSRVSVLNGGINAIAANNKDMIANPGGLTELFYMPFEDITFLLFKQQLKVYSHVSKNSTSSFALVRASESKNISELERMLLSDSYNTLTPVLIVGDQETNDDLIAHFQPFIRPNLYYFREGIEGYEHRLDLWRSMITQKNIRIDEFDKCLLP